MKSIRIAIVLILVMGIGAFVTSCAETDESDDSGNESTEEQVSAETSEQRDQQQQPEPEPEPEYDPYFGPGTFRVPADIEPGEYIVIGPESGSGYWEIALDSSGELDSIVRNGQVVRSTYVQLENGDYFKIENARALPAVTDRYEYPLEVDPSEMYEGMFKVGTDIPAGEYRLTPYDGALSPYWERRTDLRSSVEGIVANQNFTSQTYVTVQSGEYLRIKDATAELVEEATPSQSAAESEQ